MAQPANRPGGGPASRDENAMTHTRRFSVAPRGPTHVLDIMEDVDRAAIDFDTRPRRREILIQIVGE